MNEETCTVCNHGAFYSYEDDAFYCPCCDIWFEEEAVMHSEESTGIGDPNTEEDYALVLYFQAQDPVLEEFKDYMKNLTSKLEKEGYEIKNYEVENRIDEEVTSYKPYQMELHLNAKKEKLKRFRDYMNELFEKILRTKGIIVNYYSFKGEHELAGSY